MHNNNAIVIITLSSPPPPPLPPYEYYLNINKYRRPAFLTVINIRLLSGVAGARETIVKNRLNTTKRRERKTFALPVSNCRGVRTTFVWAKTKVRLYVRRHLISFDFRGPRGQSYRVSTNIFRFYTLVPTDIVRTTHRQRLRRSAVNSETTANFKRNFKPIVLFGFFVVLTNRSFGSCSDGSFDDRFGSVSRKAQRQQRKYSSKRVRGSYVRGPQSS